MPTKKELAKKLLKKQLIIFSIVAALITAGILAMIIVDENKSSFNEKKVMQARLMAEMERLYSKEQTEDTKVTFEEAKKELPKVDKIDHKFSR
jgi:ABC-type Na+ efflux pump permease subunit